MAVLSAAEHWRSHFPIFQHKTYINSCSQGALSLELRAAYDRYLADWDTKGSPWELWVERGEAARRAFARLINASSDEVAVMTSVSAGVSALMSSFDFRGRRNKVVVSDFAFPTVGQISHAQELRGARIVHVPVAGNTIPYEAFECAIDEETALVALSHVSFRTGARQDVAAVTHLAHRRGVPVLLDSYQALGSLPIDVRQLGVDFLVGGTLKYLLSSAGLAFLYIRGDLIPSLRPTAIGWFSQEDIFAMDIYHNTPSNTARRFESGTPPIPNIYAGLAGMEIIQGIGVEAIEIHIRELTAHLIGGAMRMGCHVVTPLEPSQRGALVAIKSTDVYALVDRLAGRGIVVSSREHNLRVSPHFYNNHEDIERVLEGLRANKDLLA
jgi:selenocysteine lyase/cysteine desulfurase